MKKSVNELALCHGRRLVAVQATFPLSPQDRPLIFTFRKREFVNGCRNETRARIPFAAGWTLTVLTIKRKRCFSRSLKIYLKISARALMRSLRVHYDLACVSIV